MISVPDVLLETVAAFGLIAVAEMGDKSQLVCMGLAARYRGLPVLLGAMAAFALLNLIAVLFGATVAHWLPQGVTAAVVAALFLGFGVHAWRSAADVDAVAPAHAIPRRSVLLSTFALIFVAELGDKTQLTVAGLAGTQSPAAVWAGATAGVGLTTLMAVVAGRTVMQKLPQLWIHRTAAALFLLFAVVAGVHALRELR